MSYKLTTSAKAVSMIGKQKHIFYKQLCCHMRQINLNLQTFSLTIPSGYSDAHGIFWSKIIF